MFCLFCFSALCWQHCLFAEMFPFPVLAFSLVSFMFLQHLFSVCFSLLHTNVCPLSSFTVTWLQDVSPYSCLSFLGSYCFQLSCQNVPQCPGWSCFSTCWTMVIANTPSFHAEEQRHHIENYYGLFTHEVVPSLRFYSPLPDILFPRKKGFSRHLI